MLAVSIERVAEADLPTRFGNFRILGFRQNGQEAVVLLMGEPAPARGAGPSGPGPGPGKSPAGGAAAPAPLVRLHSQCLTGDVFHSLRCDCRDQLDLSLKLIAAEGCGVVIYEQEEGRGIGLMAKLQAYELQDEGMDTVEANRRLGFDADLRGYALAAAILQHLSIGRVRLLSNNPDKVRALEAAGIQVAERVPCEAPPTLARRRYLKTKKEKLGHLLSGV